MKPFYKIRFFFDYGGLACFWSANEAAHLRFGYPIEVEKLLLSPELIQKAKALLERYDQSLNWSDPRKSLWSEGEWEDFKKAAKHFLEEVKGELGKEYEIVDESS